MLSFGGQQNNDELGAMILGLYRVAPRYVNLLNSISTAVRQCSVHKRESLFSKKVLFYQFYFHSIYVLRLDQMSPKSKGMGGRPNYSRCTRSYWRITDYYMFQDRQRRTLKGDVKPTFASGIPLFKN